MASGDNREDIMARLFVIMQSVTGIQSNARNRGLFDNEKRPAQVLLDGDELPAFDGPVKAFTNLMFPQIMELRPQVFYLPKERRPKNDSPTNIGSEANAWRMQFLQLLWADVELAQLLGSNGSIVYNGCETDLKSGSAMSGEIRLDFVVNYVLQPS